MNAEERKVKRFLDTFAKTDGRSGLAWFLTGFCIFLLLIACMYPLQGIIMDAREADRAMLLIICLISPMTAYMRIQPYSTYMEGQKTRKLFDVLNYHPIHKKVIKKLKIYYVARFMAKLLPFCMLAQIPATINEYGTVSWMNFLYIVMVAFLYPVVWCGIMIWFER